MATTKISSEWFDWVKLNQDRKCVPLDIFNQLIQSGNDPEESFQLVFNSSKFGYKNKNWVNYDTNKIYLEDKEVDIIFQNSSPEIIIFGNFLSEQECDFLIQLSKGRLIRSQVISDQTGANIHHEGRTSNNAYYKVGEIDQISVIEKRISNLLNYPINRGEGLQILNYPPGKEYKPHQDFFSFNNAETIHMKNGGQRIGTFIMYLNDVKSGGETVFPTLGMTIKPQKGSALFFSYTNDKNQSDIRTLHAGNPVIVGDKWIATKWLRQREIK